MKKISIVITFSLFFSLLLALPISALPTEVWVDDGFTTFDATHFGTIQEGIDGVDGGGTVHVAAGTYTLSAQISITKNISLLGENQATTILDGNGSVRVIYTSGLDASTIIDTFTIQNGKAENGGGMYNYRSSLTVTNCTFTNNSSDHYGGGMHNSNSSPTVTNCTFSGNSTKDGGGMFNWCSTPTVKNCTFTNNSAIDNGGGMYDLNSSSTVSNCTFTNNSSDYNGGGMHNSNSSTTVSNCKFTSNMAKAGGGGMHNNGDSPIKVTNCTFTNNSSDRYGGGMCNGASTPMVTNCTFSGNTAWDGGGMYNWISSPTVTNCTFTNNSADYNGGGMYDSNSSTTVSNCKFTNNMAKVSGGGMHNENSSSKVTNCTFTNNSANYAGGAMYNKNSSPKVTNCTFSGNTASTFGGAMYNTNSSPKVTNCTFTNNSANYFGGAMYNTNSSPMVTNCIIWGNTPDAVSNSSSSSTPTITYSDVSGGYSGTGNIDADPLFADAAGEDLSLSTDSPCIDTGTDTSDVSYGGVTDDILTIFRPQGEAYDMGAYEFVDQGWSPIVMKPLVANALMGVNSIWECLIKELPDEVPENILPLLDGVQEHMENASMLSNPVYANGELNKAMALMKQVNEALDCGCYPV